MSHLAYRAFKALIAQIHGAVAAALLTPNPARGGKRLVAEKQQSMSTPAAVLLPGPATATLTVNGSLSAAL
jgi:hypothetical protein